MQISRSILATITGLSFLSGVLLGALSTAMWARFQADLARQRIEKANRELATRAVERFMAKESRDSPTPVVSLPASKLVFAGIGEPQRIGNVTVQALNPRVNADGKLELSLAIRNETQNKRVLYSEFSPRYSTTIDNRIRDEHGNSYHLYALYNGEDGHGRVPRTIEPGQSTETILTCEKPIDAATQIDFDLTGSALEARGERIRIRIGRRDWERETNQAEH